MTANMSAKSSLASSPSPERSADPGRFAMAPGGVEPPRTDSKSVALSAELRGRAQQRSGVQGQIQSACQRQKVADGTRTHDHLDHNQGLYQLSYSHRARTQNSG